ncbi:MAG TPA: tRNA epoxyqueuosine(34) reductase QueG [Candidatus Kapabacteria bacterium]|nr:tRNA epoxyqueuosine(34) reductase QueG [Candidatus Kapabacteria bacterium]
MDRSELTRAVKQLACDVGFTTAGVTRAEPFTEEAARFEAWVESGAHGYMSYLERSGEKRRDVREILPSAKSILALSLNYYHPEPTPGPPYLKISRYAWGEDYHDVMRSMLDDLMSRIKLLVPDVEGRYYVDTGPIMDKAVAERAGIGWIGKHTNVITREVGSWVFLAEIILSLDLEPDPPATDMCGTCDRCIDACPTQAITAPYQLDATKCIPYLTIELKPEHEIPDEFDGKLDGWLFGCDICQDVCPWNRFAKKSSLQAFAPREENNCLTTGAILSMQQEEFSRRFKNSPIKRTKLAGLQRNVRALLRNTEKK